MYPSTKDATRSLVGLLEYQCDEVAIKQLDELSSIMSFKAIQDRQSSMVTTK